MVRLFPHPDEALLAACLGALFALAVVAYLREREARKPPPG